MSPNRNFPFAAVIGQEEMKLALLLNIIDPKIGGVMIFGDRGTGKSTTIRALADLLPNILVFKNDPFNTDPKNFFKDLKNFYEIEEIKIPMIELPLGATEDHLCGSLNIKEFFVTGKTSFEAGLLARANRGILYVDEINLLDGHLVDLLLDSSASGWNTIEREGLSIKHPAKFIFVGSGNEEEAQLRPQLLDRFGLCAQIQTIKDPNLRLQVVKERISFDECPEKWLKKYYIKQEILKNKLVKAQSFLSKVKVSKEFQFKISQICSEADIEGLRGDIVFTRAAKAFAALNLRKNVSSQDLCKVMPLCLRHRFRKNPLDRMNSNAKFQKLIEKFLKFI